MVQPSTRQKQQPRLLRLDPSNPVLPSLTPPLGNSRHKDDQALSQRRAKNLSQLHVALQTGSADTVWSAYLDLRQRFSGADTAYIEGDALEGNVTPKECRDMLNIIANDATKTRRGLNRVLRLVSEVRSQQRRLLARLQHVSETDYKARSRILTKEIEAWDSVLSPRLLNMIIALIGKSLRSVGLDDVDQVLDQLLTYEANELSRAAGPSRHANSANPVLASHSPDILRNLRTAMLSPVAQSALNKKVGSRRREPDFPNLATYNTILDIITRMVPRSDPARRSPSTQDHAEDEEDDAMLKFTKQHLASQSAEFNSSLANKLRRFDLDPEAAPLHLDALERADRLFHSVLNRMQRSSRIEPDPITFNIMITMYCLLDRWEAVHRVIRIMHDRHVLNIDCINNTLGRWVLREPATAKQHQSDNDAPKPAMDAALDVYRQLRQNLIYLELASHHSSFAYGSPDSYPQSKPEMVEAKLQSKDELGPLTWPDRNEPRSTESSRSPAFVPSSDAVQTVFGIPRLPQDLVPDEITHALVIRSLTWEGRFADALSVFRDLVSTPAQLPTNVPKKGEIRTVDVKTTGESLEEKKMQPTLAIFDSFFRGFSRHGIPSTVVSYDAEQPERSTWKPLSSSIPEEEGDQAERSLLQQKQKQDGRHAQQLQMWRIETFQEIFEAFLDFEPDVHQALTSTQTRTPEKPGRALSRDQENAKHRISTPLGWLSMTEKRNLDALRRSPSSNQLFWILTAIRRVSHDHAGWSLAMWRKVVDKFASNDASSTSSLQGRARGKLDWNGFVLDNRLRRVLEHLETRLSQEEGQSRDQDQEELWHHGQDER